MSWIIFDDGDAGPLRQAGVSCSRATNHGGSDAMAIALAAASDDSESVVIMPSASERQVLVLNVRKMQGALKQEPKQTPTQTAEETTEHKLERAPEQKSDLQQASEPAFEQKAEHLSEPTPVGVESPRTGFTSSGILGLDGDAVYLDELPERKPWWKRIF